MLRSLVLLSALALLTPVVAGCSSQKYVTPGAAVSMQSLIAEDTDQRQRRIEREELGRGTDRGIAKILAVQPAAEYPAHIVAARLQSSGYYNRWTDSYGHGRYSVVTTRDVETDEAVEGLAAMPFVAQFSSMNRLVLASHLEDLTDLRESAAAMRADLLLIYTFDTRFRVKDHDVGPLNIIVLGNLRNQEAMVTTTASAAFLDVRTGYLYGTAEGTALTSKRSSIWRTRDAIDDARQKTEAEAFEELIPELKKCWAGIVEQYGPMAARDAGIHPGG